MFTGPEFDYYYEGTVDENIRAFFGSKQAMHESKLFRQMESVKLEMIVLQGDLEIFQYKLGFINQCRVNSFNRSLNAFIDLCDIHMCFATKHGLEVITEASRRIRKRFKRLIAQLYDFSKEIELLDQQFSIRNKHDSHCI
ncbi:hypothetical protein CF8_0180 [Aeromonas phage CF8]|nr:hypothetical protein CF8_0180 [Aeromonas phage CF8]